MARRKKLISLKREIGVDERYGSELIQKFINVIMLRGKKGVARQIVYDAIDLISKKAGNNKEKGLETFYRAFDQVFPAIEVRPRRVGGSVYQIPVEVRPERRRALAMRWIIDAAKKRSDKTMGDRLGYELLEASEGRGDAVKKKLDVHKMAEANRAFSHYAW
ncbi:MAG: 30S ribosomal protein S7 [Candidatus Dependentiae bacterium ADurb.Bin331]|nr:MAG: 30S ribosomal protein S7 [Candidatus Dependentiae bacterium ADurb.Bin331]